MRLYNVKNAPSPPHGRGIHKSLRLPLAGLGGLFFCLALCGCGTRTAPDAVRPSPSPDADTLAVGVTHRAIGMDNGTGVDLIDVDMTRAHVSLRIVTEGIGRAGGMIGGQARTPHEWLDKTHALACVNGGYFGREDSAGHKEFVGLLVQGGRIRHAAPPLTGRGGTRARAGRYVRSVLGFDQTGLPTIAYAATDPGHPQALRIYPAAALHGRGIPWQPQSGVGCGPMLVHDGRSAVTDRQERLASDGALPRTFAAYDKGAQGPGHFVIGMASGMEYRDLAAFVVRYFDRYDHTQAQAAMCLDGGASTQLSYRTEAAQSAQSPRETGVTVPDAVVIAPRP